MAVERVDKGKCIGCGTCVKSCPMDVFRKDIDGKSIVAYPKDCVLCCVCIADCPTDAIVASKGADWMTSGY